MTSKRTRIDAVEHQPEIDVSQELIHIHHNLEDDTPQSNTHQNKIAELTMCKLEKVYIYTAGATFYGLWDFS